MADRNRHFFVMAVSIALAAPVGSAGAQSCSDEHCIVISMEQTTHLLGEPIPLIVAYHNNSTTDWKLEQPGKSMGVYLRCDGLRGEPAGVGYSLGKPMTIESRLPDGRVITSIVAPDTPKTTIPAGGKYEFVTVMNAPLREALTPRDWVVRIEDEKQKIESNRLDFSIRLTAEVVPRLLKTARGDGPHCYWAQGWLARLKPDLFRYRSIKYLSEQDWPEELQRSIAAVRRQQLDEFEAFWRKNQETAALRATLEWLNDDEAPGVNYTLPRHLYLELFVLLDPTAIVERRNRLSDKLWQQWRRKESLRWLNAWRRSEVLINNLDRASVAGYDNVDLTEPERILAIQDVLDLQARFLPRLEEHLATAYSIPPLATDELHNSVQQNVRGYVHNTKIHSHSQIRTELITAVERRIVESSETTAPLPTESTTRMLDTPMPEPAQSEEISNQPTADDGGRQVPGGSSLSDILLIAGLVIGLAVVALFLKNSRSRRSAS